MKHLVCSLVIYLLAISFPLHSAAEKALTIVHTNDMHSHFLGTGPNIDYTPASTGDDETIGGWARVASVIKTIKAERNNAVLVLDAGDFLMGSLYHMLCREQAFELQLMHMMGYDMVTLGNHEFDLKPDGLARILTTAHGLGRIPPIVFSNAIFSAESPADDSLEKVFASGLVKPYRVLEKKGLRIGFFGLIGKDAAEVAPFASPLAFADPMQTARRMVQVLREQENVDVVICLSHSGLSANSKRSEDELLAKEVDGIDIIISGHTHTRLNRALQVNNTVIVQAWENGKQAGVLDVLVERRRMALKKYRIIDIDDSIEGDPVISKKIRAFEGQVAADVLADENLQFKEIIAHSDFDLKIKAEESNLGNLITDAIRWYVDQNDSKAGDPTTKAGIAIVSNGVIRDPILRGKTGKIAVCDAFRSIPLGIGFDKAETMGYPLIAIYVYPSEVKKALEILTSIYPLKGWDYFIQVSGVRFTYNPNRMIFDRVTEVWLGNEEEGYWPLDYSGSERTLIRVIADIYNASFLKIIGNFTWHVLHIVPKDQNGNPIEDLKTVRVDADPNQPGIQELKEWQAVLAYIRSFADIDGDGIPNISPKYKGPLGRIVAEASWNPYKLLKRGTYVTWLALSALMLGLLILLSAGWFVWKKIHG